MKEIYKLSTLGLGTLITIAVSLACSYWFFHSLMGGDGYQAIGAGIAGCAIQLFGYGFAVTYLPINNALRVGLCIVPLGLSMLSTYSALYGYLSHEKDTGVINTRKQELIFNILEQSAEDKKIASAAADQGVGQSYRSQAKKFLELNNKSRDKDEQLLSKLDKEQENKRAASPLDGLVKVTGDSELTTIIFCVWLAIMFDMLPVVSIGVFSRKKEEDRYVIAHHGETLADMEAVEHKPVIKQRKEKPEWTPREQPVKNPLPEKKKVSSNKDNHAPATARSTSAPKGYVKKHNNLDDSLIINEIMNGNIRPTYKDIMEFTGWTKHKTAPFINRCLDQGVLQKKGNKFILVENVTYLQPQVANG
ncbi:MAG: hypothetical protein HOM14_03800 [Gammaproteobacteria bacterium]|jgi:hypothetical protein|nr:hypothetical protein [Gammaproteobacteria bacterium]MBT4076713.1 hypothetical protein [Gammaproteobacteria bacterium]MBT4194792.1 hypothetical protein [Gammaproteobacteria bacterium]MBT4451248.1 hypothetical protein [Gammaproteobacteria bacterium]MBT4859216.1 hypothetical protein [Gammaproteobacteria bacterium]